MRFIVTALDSEARPLLEHYQLQALPDAMGFRVYRNDDTALIVSGMGRVNAAAAVAYLQALLGHGRCHSGRYHAWLNVGIGGHRDHPLGSAWLAHEISCGDCHWHPPLVIDPPCSSTHLVTVDSPETRYPEPVIYEMEAAGFYAIARRFSSGEMVQVIKVISDSATHPVSKITPAVVQQLISQQLETVITVLDRLTLLANEAAGASING